MTETRVVISHGETRRSRELAEHVRSLLERTGVHVTLTSNVDSRTDGPRRVEV